MRRIRSRWARDLITLLFATAGLLVATGCAAAPAVPPTSTPPPTPRAERSAELNFLYTEGAKIVDARGNEVLITGVSWFGMETNTLSPHGLWVRNLEDMLDQIADLGFNTIRLPYSNEIFDPQLEPTAIDYQLNPKLEGLTPLELMDAIVERAGERGLKIILDRHRSTSDGQDKLWYTDEVSEERWIADWQLLAERYRGNDTVIGADLHNEPAGEATWGSGDPRTDWRLAAERAGNAIHEVNPDWLIVVEGIERTEDDFGGVLGWYWMGGSLQYARQYPVRLDQPDKLVYSPHDYGPGVWELQSWFMDPEFPANLPKIWDYHWGYLHKENIAPVLVGEFGGRSVGDDTEGQWQRALVDYLRENGIGYLYWSFNGNSGDTGGILTDDWNSIEQDKYELLATHQGPPLAVHAPHAIDLTAKPGPRPPMRELKALHKDEVKEAWVAELLPVIHVANKTTADMDISDLELRYWFTADGAPGEAELADHQVRVIDAYAGQLAVSRDLIHTRLVRDEVSDSGQGPVYYVEITFAAGARVPARETLGIEIAVSREDGGTYFQGNDYSRREYHWQTAWERIGMYRDGELIWGLEPRTYLAREREKELERERRLEELAQARKAEAEASSKPWNRLDELFRQLAR